MCEIKLNFETNINNINLKDVCGKLVIDFKNTCFDTKLTNPMSNIYFDSTILTKNNQFDLLQLCDFNGKDFKLLYRATRDGFSAQSFHSKCDNIPNTLTVVKTTNNNIFGGYTEQTWDGECIYKNDPNAFLFSLVNPSSKSEKGKVIEPQYAICCGSNYGPIFGRGYDLSIVSYSNINQKSYLNNRSYQLNNYLDDSDYFQTIEIEIFHVI